MIRRVRSNLDIGETAQGDAGGNMQQIKIHDTEGIANGHALVRLNDGRTAHERELLHVGSRLPRFGGRGNISLPGNQQHAAALALQHAARKGVIRCDACSKSNVIPIQNVVFNSPASHLERCVVQRLTCGTRHVARTTARKRYRLHEAFGDIRHHRAATSNKHLRDIIRGHQDPLRLVGQVAFVVDQKHRGLELEGHGACRQGVGEAAGDVRAAGHHGRSAPQPALGAVGVDGQLRVELVVAPEALHRAVGREGGLGARAHHGLAAHHDHAGHAQARQRVGGGVGQRVAARQQDRAVQRAGQARGRQGVDVALAACHHGRRAAGRVGRQRLGGGGVVLRLSSKRLDRLVGNAACGKRTGPRR